MTARALVKDGMERALLAGGLARHGRARRRAQLLVLAYHDILPEGATAEGERSLHLSRRDFAAQLDMLADTHHVVPLADILSGRRPGGDRPSVAITFDDAYRGAVTHGVEELARRGMPATMFVAPGCLGSRGLWWDLLVQDGAGALSDAARLQVLQDCHGWDTAARAWAAAAGLALREPAECHAIATSRELRDAAAYPGLTIGSHSWSHRNLAALPTRALREELARPIGWLRDRFERFVPWLAYPYGLTSEEVRRAAAEAGYVAGLCIDGGWVGARVERPYDIPRLNVPAGITRRGFELRAAGVITR